MERPKDQVMGGAEERGKKGESPEVAAAGGGALSGAPPLDLVRPLVPEEKGGPLPYPSDASLSKL